MVQLYFYKGQPARIVMRSLIFVTSYFFLFFGNLSYGGYPIIASFERNFRMCASDCEYLSLGLMGDLRHQAKRSCHNSGSAIDINGITCNGKNFGVNSQRFHDFLSCMGEKDNMFVLFGRAGHIKHAHISLASCELQGKGKIQTLNLKTTSKFRKRQNSRS